MPSVKRHYENLLAHHYSWMFGMPFAEKIKEQKQRLQDLGVTQPGIVVDLGCGSGFQSFAMAELGAKKILAVDTSVILLEELRRHRADEPIETHQHDLVEFRKLLTNPVDLILCMGDTLTHLEVRESVTTLFRDAYSTLESGGRLVISFRDLSTMPTGLERFIPVQSSEDKIMTCFLETTDKGKVSVHDLIYIREKGSWALHKSAYQKLVLPLQGIKDELEQIGFIIKTCFDIRGMFYLSATKP